MSWNDLCSEIDSLERCLRDGSEEALQERAASLRRAAATGTALDDLLTQCFALVREAARRTLGLRPFREQILAETKAGLQYPDNRQVVTVFLR